MNTKITLVKLLLLIAITLFVNPVIAQTDTLNISGVKFFDRFNNIHNPNDLIVPSGEDIIRHSHQCTAGFFQLNLKNLSIYLYINSK